MTFIDKLRNRWQQADSLLCVGLDPDLTKLPEHYLVNADADASEALFAFCRDIVDVTAEYACAFKPQIAYFAAHNGGEAALQRLIAHINGAHPDVPVILDAKRGDIGSTAQQYAEEAFERYGADAVTLNPYMGKDSAAPFLAWNNRGCVFLCHTSNPGARDFQELDVGGAPLYQHIARTIAQDWNTDGNCALVVGATFPEELKVIRGIVGDMPLLIPGVGAQGGDVEAVVTNGKTIDGSGLMINSSRGILYASRGEGYAEAAANAAKSLRDEIKKSPHPTAAGVPGLPGTPRTFAWTCGASPASTAASRPGQTFASTCVPGSPPRRCRACPARHEPSHRHAGQAPHLRPHRGPDNRSHRHACPALRRVGAGLARHAKNLRIDMRGKPRIYGRIAARTTAKGKRPQIIANTAPRMRKVRRDASNLRK